LRRTARTKADQSVVDHTSQFNIETVDDRADSWLDAWRADSTVSPLVLEVRFAARPATPRGVRRATQRAALPLTAWTLGAIFCRKHAVAPTPQVLLLPHAPAATGVSGAPDASSAGGMVLLERWVLAHERAAALDVPSSPTQLPRRPSLFESARSLEVPVIYKRTVIMLRSLYALLRTLPAHRLFLASKARSLQ
jgi:hypothetical protein